MTTVPVGERNVGLSAEIDARLNTFFAERIAVSAQYGSDYERLWAQAAAASDGGKRIRPRFVLSAFEAFGGSDGAAAVDVAVAFELLHTAVLLHDDVMDRDTVRRGRLNL
ncbi:polyprenyl synthetase family protein, partial [Kitasatospora herbaricolor]|uniref:polyprenyl synthetase family protein n=1 Tax=Kitasatospora herbaricolor TaxID=68217 RepID=UPI0036DE0FA8